MRGADLLVGALKDAGVSRIFALSGNQIMPIFDACIDAEIAITHTRHEAAAVFMAEAYAQLTGGVGVALVTAGGGLANTPGALFSARASETPLLLLSGDSPVGQDGKGAFQEMDQTAITAAVTKRSERCGKSSGLANDIAEAIGLACATRPGPVHLALPFDLLTGDAGDASTPETAHSGAPDDNAALAAAEAISGRLEKAEKPLILLGPSLNRTRAPSLHGALSDAVDAPVLAMESPRGLNDPSLGRLRDAVEAADLIVSLGKKVDFTTGFGAGTAKWLVVDTEETERHRARKNLGNRLTGGLDACPKAVAQELLKAGKAGDRAAWRKQVAEWTRPAVSAGPETAAGKITSVGLCAAIGRCVAACKDAVFVSDGGEVGQWAQAMVGADARVINGVSGAIGGGLPYGIGARTARPDASVFVLSGDGSIGFHLAEFETAVREDLPFVLVIGNDLRWNAEHQIQLRNYGPERLSGCSLSPARYDLAAEALGAHGEFVTSPDELQPALQRAMESGKPACLNVLIDGLPAPSAH